MGNNKSVCLTRSSRTSSTGTLVVPSTSWSDLKLKLNVIKQWRIEREKERKRMKEKEKERQKRTISGGNPPKIKHVRALSQPIKALAPWIDIRRWGKRRFSGCLPQPFRVGPALTMELRKSEACFLIRVKYVRQLRVKKSRR